MERHTPRGQLGFRLVVRMTAFIGLETQDDLEILKSQTGRMVRAQITLGYASSRSSGICTASFMFERLRGD